MLATPTRESDGSRRGKPREAEAAAATWENEGGASRNSVGAAAPLVVEHPAGWKDPTPRQVVALETREDDLMGIESPDGHPPAPWLRRLEWGWLAIGAAVLLIAGTVWVSIRGVDWPTVLGASGIILALLAAASPMWGAVLLRARDQRTARREACAELQAGKSRVRASPPGPA